MIGIETFLLHFKRSWQHHPVVQLTGFLVLTGTFTIIFSMTLFFSNLERVLISWGSSVQMNIYVSDSKTDEEIKKIESDLKSLKYFERIEFIDKKKAADSFFKKMSNYVPDFQNEKDFISIIPASFSVDLEKNVQISELEKIAKKIASMAGVEDISYGKEWIQNFSVFLSSIKNISLAISLVLLLGAFFVISFTVYSMVVKRKDEIEILKLFGATKKMIQSPYLFEGGLMCLLASISALLLSYFILTLQNKVFISEMSYLGMNEIFEFFGFFQIALLTLICVTLGVVCSLICIKRMDKSLKYSGDLD